VDKGIDEDVVGFDVGLQLVVGPIRKGVDLEDAECFVVLISGTSVGGPPERRA
jgi:hypothetical protein